MNKILISLSLLLSAASSQAAIIGANDFNGNSFGFSSTTGLWDTSKGYAETQTAGVIIFNLATPVSSGWLFIKVDDMTGPDGGTHTVNAMTGVMTMQSKVGDLVDATSEYGVSLGTSAPVVGPQTLVMALNVSSGRSYVLTDLGLASFNTTTNTISGYTALGGGPSDTITNIRLVNGGGGFRGAYDNLIVATLASDVGITVVPEPSTYGLIGAGLLAGLAFIRRRK